MLLNWFQIGYLFILYSFLGWCTEVAFQAICNSRVVNRGFLNGPVCPIYGIGVIVVLLLLEPYSDNIIWLFIGGMFLTTAIELIGGWILDTAFHMRWWDYSEEPYNYRGYICIRFSIIWGLAIVGVIKILHPILMDLINLIPHTLGLILLLFIIGCFILDIIVTVYSTIGFRKNLHEMDMIAVRIHDVSDNLTGIVSSSALKADREIKEIKQKANEQKIKTRENIQNKQKEFDEKLEENLRVFNAKLEKITEKRKDMLETNFLKTVELEDQYNKTYNNIKSSFAKRRLLKAYPKMHRSDNKLPLHNEIVGLRHKISRIKNMNCEINDNDKNDDK